MPDTQLFGIGSGRTARSAATTGASIGASIGSRFGPVGAGVASGFGGAVGYLIGSSLDGVTPIPDGGRPIEPDGSTGRAEPMARVTDRDGRSRTPALDRTASTRVSPVDPAPPTSDPDGSTRRDEPTEPVFIDVVEE